MSCLICGEEFSHADAECPGCSGPPNHDGDTAGSRSADAAREETTFAAPVGRLHALHEVAACIRIGRAPDNDLVVDDLLVSSYHAELQTEDGHRVDIVDLDSHYGTFVNGQPVSRQRLGDLDLVSIGRHQYRLAGRRLEEYVDSGEVTFSASGLGVVVDGRPLLQDVSFHLDSREFLAIVGPSGSGKSTLLKALNGFRPATSGTVFYAGRDLYTHYQELRTRIGYVPQDDILHLDLTVAQALAYGAELRFPPDVTREERQQRVAEVLEELGMTARQNTAIKDLSGGERKRTSVALELLTKPSLLFLDEATSGLDPGHERTLIDVLRHLTKEGRTIVLVTHSVDSMRVCDQSLFLAPGGKLAFVGIPLLAPQYFEQDDFQAVFQGLSTEPDRDWTAEFNARSGANGVAKTNGAPTGLVHGETAPGTSVEATPISCQPATRPEGDAQSAGQAAPPRAHSWVRQTSALTRRYTRLLARTNLKLLLLQAPVLGLLMLVALPAHELGPPAKDLVRLVSRAPLVLLVIVLASTWLGASNAVEEIVKELPILRRERAAGLSLSAYLASKVIVLGALTLVQTAILVPIALVRQGNPVSASAIGWPTGEFLAAAALAGLAGMALGLLVSAAAGTPAKAVTILPVLLILEMLLAMGGLFPDVVDHPVLKQATYGASTSWAFAAAGSTADLNRLQALNNVTLDVNTKSVTQSPIFGQLGRPDPASEKTFARLLNPGDRRLRHDSRTWWRDMGAVGGLTGLCLAATALALRRQTHPSRA